MPIVLIIWIALAFFLGLAARANGRSFWVWFLLGIVIDPILAWIVYKIVVRGR